MTFFPFSSENGETQNETPSESDKMDISEVSDQVSPVSEQVRQTCTYILNVWVHYKNKTKEQPVIFTIDLE